MVNHIQQVIKLDGEYSGAMDGLFSPDRYSKIKNLDAGSVFLYMFRRFGYPGFGWDGQKTLVKWILTTDMDGVLLEVQPNVTGAGTFGYLLRGDIDLACMEEKNKDRIDKAVALMKNEQASNYEVTRECGLAQHVVRRIRKQRVEMTDHPF